MHDQREVGEQAVWSLSTAKPGNGVEQLRDDNTDTYWQCVSLRASRPRARSRPRPRRTHRLGPTLALHDRAAPADLPLAPPGLTARSRT